jgi:hypothetical protein
MNRIKASHRWWWIVGDAMVWLGAGLMIASVILTIWMVLHG